MKITSSRRIYAAGEDDDNSEDNDLPAFDYDSLMDEVDEDEGRPHPSSDLDPDLEEGDIEEDTAEQEDLTNNIPEDAITIATDNNIVDHYIAECDECYGIFISSVIKTENSTLHSISGECPLCGKTTEQQLKWLIQTNPAFDKDEDVETETPKFNS